MITHGGLKVCEGCVTWVRTSLKKHIYCYSVVTLQFQETDPASSPSKEIDFGGYV